MAKFFKSQKIKTVIFSSILIIFGLLFCLLPEKSLELLEIILSTLLIVYGIICFFGFVFSPIMLRDPVMLVEGIIFIVVGVLLDFFPSLFVIGIGTIIIIGGLKQIYNSIDLKILDAKTWWIDLCLGLAFTALGVVIIVLRSTKVSTMIVSIMLGVTLILDGICYLMLLFALKREVKKIRKEVNEKLIEIQKNTEENSD